MLMGREGVDNEKRRGNGMVSGMRLVGISEEDSGNRASGGMRLLGPIPNSCERRQSRKRRNYLLF